MSKLKVPPSDLAAELEEQYGLVVGGRMLSRLLGYPSQQAFRQAALRDAVPVPLFAIERRKGKFAKTRDIAAWLASLQPHKPPLP